MGTRGRSCVEDIRVVGATVWCGSHAPTVKVVSRRCPVDAHPAGLGGPDSAVASNSHVHGQKTAQRRRMMRAPS